MFEFGYITKGEVIRCINYLLCRREDDDSEFSQDFEIIKVKRKRFAHGVLGYDRVSVWDYFTRNTDLKKILEARRISDIDYLLFKAWDYYDLDMPWRYSFFLTTYDEDVIIKDSERPILHDNINGGVIMLTTELLSRLKRKNVSKDAEKSKQRLKNDFSSASKAQKQAIVELSGLHITSIYNACKTGAVSARLALSFAQVLKVSPFYYSAEQDKRTKLNFELIPLFLQQLGYNSLLKELRSPAEPKPIGEDSKKLEPSASEEEPNATESEPDDKSQTSDTNQSSGTFGIQLNLPDSSSIQTAVDELSEDGWQLLLKALFIRAKAGGQAKQYAELVKRCLLM